MTPIARFMNSLTDLISGTLSSTMSMLENMDPVQLATLSICVLVIGAMCLRGNPVRGA